MTGNRQHSKHKATHSVMFCVRALSKRFAVFACCCRVGTVTATVASKVAAAVAGVAAAGVTAAGVTVAGAVAPTEDGGAGKC